MFVLADSGSTKTHFKIVVDREQVVDITAPGINPYFQTKEEIEEILRKCLLPDLEKEEATTAFDFFFYGSGVGNAEKRQIVESCIKDVFPQSTPHAESDLYGACRALYGNGSGIVCILGTGSNSCVYKNGKIEKNTPSLGFILGDEGGGASLGKNLVANCMKHIYPIQVEAKFYNYFKTNPKEIMDHVYNQSFPNRYLASMVPFVVDNISSKEMQNLVYRNFKKFFSRNLTQYGTEVKMLPIGIVGSVAAQFSEILKQVAYSCGLKVDKICKDPIEGLTSYHLTNDVL